MQAVIPRVWTVAGFTTWVVLAIGWLFCGSFLVVIWPAVESRAALAYARCARWTELTLRSKIGGGMLRDCFGQRPSKPAASSTA